VLLSADTIQEIHFDTRMPTNANDYLIGRWKASCFIGRIIDELFSVKSPSYSVVQSLDTELRKLCAEVGPGAVCANLPQDSFVSGSRPNIKAQLTPMNPNDPSITTVMESHSLAMIHAALFISKLSFLSLRPTHTHLPHSYSLSQDPIQSSTRGSRATSVTFRWISSNDSPRNRSSSRSDWSILDDLLRHRSIYEMVDNLLSYVDCRCRASIVANQSPLFLNGSS